MGGRWSLICSQTLLSALAGRLILRDVTRRKEAEREIAEKSAILETTFESMSKGIVVYDADLTLVASNRRYLDLSGYPPGSVRLGMS